ncbi:hypothetical protein [Variovorax paradoxus]|uniref:hypothetical protein n=1 Tax=Variovorax paradoxus TaxID=34073 RepID=UPI00277D1807|nr:hypothetical protein [Variovorax paradoxus]MDP9928170.1 hypothetical protein [Variovorax paradoxus]
MIRIHHHLAGVLAAAGLSGCIMLPPPPLHGPPPGWSRHAGFRGEAPPMSPMAAWGVCDGQAEGARPVLPGPRADSLSGTCERGPGGALEFRPPQGR